MEVMRNKEGAEQRTKVCLTRRDVYVARWLPRMQREEEARLSLAIYLFI